MNPWNSLARAATLLAGLALAPASAPADYVYNTINNSTPGLDSYAAGINNSGQIVGSTLYSLNGQSFSQGFLDSGGVYTQLTDPLSIPPPRGAIGSTTANGINDSGQIVGGYTSPNVDRINHAFLYSGGVYTTIDDPSGAQGTTAEGINNSGQIVGNFTDSTGKTHGFLDSGGVYTTIDDPLGAKGTYANGINASGQIVGHYTDVSGVDHGFLYSGGAYTTLDDPLGAKGSYARGINASGQIVGGYEDSFNDSNGFLYSGGVYTTVDDPLDTTSNGADGINDSGLIVGGYSNVGYLATPTAVPEPSSLLMCGLGVICAAALAARWRL